MQKFFTKRIFLLQRNGVHVRLLNALYALQISIALIITSEVNGVRVCAAAYNAERATNYDAVSAVKANADKWPVSPVSFITITELTSPRSTRPRCSSTRTNDNTRQRGSTLAMVIFQLPRARDIVGQRRIVSLFFFHAQLQEGR